VRGWGMASPVSWRSGAAAIKSRSTRPIGAGIHAPGRRARLHVKHGAKPVLLALHHDLAPPEEVQPRLPIPKPGLHVCGIRTFEHIKINVCVDSVSVVAINPPSCISTLFGRGTYLANAADDGRVGKHKLLPHGKVLLPVGRGQEAVVRTMGEMILGNYI
jgi:hypothetical protein